MKKFKLFFLVMASFFILTACGNNFDAKGYVQSILDSSTKGEFDEYMKLTDSTKEECEELYQKNLDDVMKEFQSLNISEDLQNKYRNLFIKMYKQTKYTVTESTKDKENNFEVTVEIEPLLVFEDFESELTDYQDELIETIQNDLLDGKEMPSDDEMMEQIFAKIYDMLNEKVENPEYGEKETITVAVTGNSKKEYSISDEDLEKLDETMIGINNLNF